MNNVHPFVPMLFLLFVAGSMGAVLVGLLR
jgi:hypothetical protein